MKKLIHLFMLLLLAAACRQDDLKARSGEFCFVVKGEKIEVTNNTREIVYFDLIDPSGPDSLNSAAFDCSTSYVLNPGKSTTYELDDFISQGKRPLKASWWRCNNQVARDSSFSGIETNRESMLCTKFKE